MMRKCGTRELSSYVRGVLRLSSMGLQEKKDETKNLCFRRFVINTAGGQ